jgi:ribonuclease HII
VANKRTLHSIPLPHFSSLTLECGIDEAGRGCLAGPVVAAAVILPKNFSHPLIYDSKALTLFQREEVESVIKDAATAYAIAEVSAQIIDEINRFSNIATVGIKFCNSQSICQAKTRLLLRR